MRGCEKRGACYRKGIRLTMVDLPSILWWEGRWLGVVRRGEDREGMREGLSGRGVCDRKGVCGETTYDSVVVWCDVMQ